MKHCNRLPREVVDAPSLETFYDLAVSLFLFLFFNQTLMDMVKVHS